MRILVMHSGYGCDTGCCGHVVEVEDLAEGEQSPLQGSRSSNFEFAHPWDDDHRKFAEDLVREKCGEEHVKDLDWENSIVVDD